MKVGRTNQIRINDDEKVKHVLVGLELERGQTVVVSNFSAWENIGLLLEAVGASMRPKSVCSGGLGFVVVGVLRVGVLVVGVGELVRRRSFRT